MEYSLKRLLLYSNKEEKEEFDLPEDVLRIIYGLFITSKVRFPYSTVSFTQVFNEVFYMLTCIHVDKTSPEHVAQYLNEAIVLTHEEDIYIEADERECMYDEEERIKYNKNQLFLVQRYIFSFVWMVLSMYQNPPEHVHYFLIGLEAMFKSDNNPYYDEFKGYLKSHPAKIDQPFIIRPRLDIRIMLRSIEEWKEVTLDFDRTAVSNIVCRFVDLEDRKMLVDEIKRVLAKANEDPNSSQKVSMVSHHLKANNAFLDEILKQKEEEEKRAVELGQKIEKSKDECIAELKAQVKNLEKEKRDAESDRDHWKREYEHLIRKFNDRNRKLESQKIPAEFKQLPGSEIIQQLIYSGLIRVLYRQGNSNSEDMLYKWEGSKKLFGYFVERVSDELSLRKSGKSGNIIWEPFMQAFYESEDLRHEAASAISAMKKKGALMPDGADKIEDAIKYATAMAAQYKY